LHASASISAPADADPVQGSDPISLRKHWRRSTASAAARVFLAILAIQWGRRPRCWPAGNCRTCHCHKFQRTRAQPRNAQSSWRASAWVL